MKIIESTPFSVSPCGCGQMRWRGLCFAFRQLMHRRVFFWSTSAIGTDCLQKKLLRNHLQLLPFPSFSSLRFPIPFFPHISAEKNCSKKGKSAMIEAKASGPRERKETVFNEKKTVRDFGSSFGMSALAEESVQARFTDYDQVNQTITVMPGRIPRRNWGISMASPPFWRWMDSSSRT